MVRLSEIKIENNGDWVRMYTYITIGNNTPQKMWIETSKEYSEYLTYERSDAFVVGILNWAMREGHDIICDAPMGEHLYYQITRYVIPGLVAGSSKMHPIKIECEIDSTLLPNAGCVATGVTCGVDSLYSIMTNEDSLFPLHKLTHLTFFNVGSHGEGEQADKIFKERLRIAESFCNECNYPLVVINSNLHQVIHQDHFFSASYSACFAILALQKMWNIYYLASAGNDYNSFTLKNNHLRCSEDYEIFLLPLLSTNQLHIDSSGAGVTRQNKLKAIKEYRPSYKHLNVCTIDGPNCSRCEKCIRTMIGLESLGVLDRYKDVFDLDFYYKNKNYCYSVFLQKYYTGWKLHAEIYPFIKKDIPTYVKIKEWIKTRPLWAKKLYLRKFNK